MKNTPQSAWLRHDWQISPFAPKLRIVQALVAGGKTASGAGFSRYDALQRCLGETAEIMALEDGEGSEGLAAGPDFNFAARQALTERLERWAIREWWHGRLRAQPIVANDLIAELREGATPPRETSIWLLPDFKHINVAVALSRTPAGTEPILGFGANICPVAAARSALIELGLMELNVIAPSAGLTQYFKRINARATECFPQGKTTRPAPVPLDSTEVLGILKNRLSLAQIMFSLQDLTPPETGLSVVRATIPDAPSWGRTLGPLL